jgi:hypothetical protein
MDITVNDGVEIKGGLLLLHKFLADLWNVGGHS